MLGRTVPRRRPREVSRPRGPSTTSVWHLDVRHLAPPQGPTQPHAREEANRRTACRLEGATVTGVGLGAGRPRSGMPSLVPVGLHEDTLGPEVDPGTPGMARARDTATREAPPDGVWRGLRGWTGWDCNPRPPPCHAGALPNCATAPCRSGTVPTRFTTRPNVGIRLTGAGSRPQAKGARSRGSVDADGSQWVGFVPELCPRRAASEGVNLEILMRHVMQPDGWLRRSWPGLGGQSVQRRYRACQVVAGAAGRISGSAKVVTASTTTRRSSGRLSPSLRRETR